MIDPTKITAPTINEQPPTTEEREVFLKYLRVVLPDYSPQGGVAEINPNHFRQFRLAVAYGRALQAEETPVTRIKAYRGNDPRLNNLSKPRGILLRSHDQYFYFNDDELIALLDIQPLPKTPEEIQAEKDADEDEKAWVEHQKAVGKHEDREDNMLAYAHFLAGRRSMRAAKGGA